MDLNREIQIAYKDNRFLNLKKGSIVPNFIYVKDNEIHDFYNILDKNKKTILIFWASWCPNCDEVINYLENHNIRDTSNTNIITISIDSIPQKSNHFIVMNDPNKETFKAFNGKYVPTAYVISNNDIEDIIVGSDDILGFFNNSMFFDDIWK